jgi:uncharacterized protein (TIGR02186 family)
MLRRLFLWLIFSAYAAMPVGVLAAPPLVADLSSKQIRITTDFTGANLLLFGAMDGAGDVVVVVRGPRAQTVVRRKERIGGIWVNGSERVFNSVPGYYFVAGSRPLDEITDGATLDRLRIGVDRIPLELSSSTDPQDVQSFREGLIDLKQEQGLFSAEPAKISIAENRLFRVDLTFPSNVPTGPYTADIYLFRNGKPVGSSQTTLAVRKAGLEAAVYDFAHRHSAFYGIFAIVIALFAGWLAGAIFRKA